MKSFLMKCGLVVGFLSSMNLFAENRITSKNNKAMRCNGGVSSAECADMRNKALKLGCITQDEHGTLERYGSFPVCNVFKQDQGLKMLDGWCACGCFAPDTLIDVLNKEEGIHESVSAAQVYDAPNGDYELEHLDADSSINNFSFGHAPIRLKTRGKEPYPMVIITTKLGHRLSVTSKHPVMTRNGSMKAAEDLNFNDLLLTKEGKAVEIERIERVRTDEQVVNFATERKGALEHMLFANGLLVGDLFWQSALEDLRDQVAIRK